MSSPILLGRKRILVPVPVPAPIAIFHVLKDPYASSTPAYGSGREYRVRTFTGCAKGTAPVYGSSTLRCTCTFSRNPAQAAQVHPEDFLRLGIV